MMVDSSRQYRKQNARSWAITCTAALSLCAALLLAPLAAHADTTTISAPRGPVTNLPLPRFVSLKASEANVRRGPSLSHRIDWIYKHRNMPLRITAEHEHWRRVEDREGFGGWVHYSLISGSRTVLVERDLLPLHQRPDANAPVVAAFEAGVVAHLGKCLADWCRVSKDGHRGWARKTALWGVAASEIRK